MVFETIESADSSTPAVGCRILDDVGIEAAADPRGGDRVTLMGRIERKLFRIADRIAELGEEERAVLEELDMHRSIHDDAVRDAVVSESQLDRFEADLTGADVARFQRRLDEIGRERERLEVKRSALLEQLG